MPNTDAPSLRLFFALWPEDAARERLRCVALARPEARPARIIPAANLHLTLAFLGEQSPDKLPCILRAAENIRVGAFTLCLDQIGFWPQPQILWLGASQPPPALAELAANLGKNLAECGIALEKRPFQAHLTLARQCRRGPMPPQAIEAPLAWPVKAFALVASSLTPGGSVYRVMQTWPLIERNEE